MSDYLAARHNMIENQIRTNRVTDERILDAFQAVPRELFVPDGLRPVAYADEDLHLGGGRYLIEPMVLARLLQTAAPRGRDGALIIGDSTGYVTAVLSRLVASVIAVEEDGESVVAGNQRLSDLEIDNAALVAGAPSDGHRRQAPYDLILIAGGIEEIPDALLVQLGEGGRLVTVQFEPGTGVGRAMIIRNINGICAKRTVFDANTPLLSEFARAPAFVF